MAALWGASGSDVPKLADTPFRKGDSRLILTFPADFRMLPSMEECIQGGLNGRVLIPPEKRFLIHKPPP